MSVKGATTLGCCSANDNSLHGLADRDPPVIRTSFMCVQYTLL